MKKFIKNIMPIAAGLTLVFGATSCVKDLDVDPLDPNMSTEVSAEGLFNKCYANIAMAGNGGANGDCDIDGIDGGTSGFIRQMWNSNELPTDEAINGWGDDGIEQSCFNTYDESHPMLNGYFARLTTGITYCNQYLNIAADYDATMTAEVRFLRALDYYLLMDAFGRVPFSETLAKPVIMSRQEIYSWLEEELLTNIEPNLSAAAPKKSSDSGYGRVDKAAAWILLSRLYLNAEVYTGTAQWAKAAEYAKKVIDSAYKLNTTSVNGWSAYQMLFMGDNGESAASVEAIFPILQDGLTTTSWGTSQFLCAGSFDSDMHANPNDPNGTNGLSGQVWGGNRTRPSLIQKFFPNLDAPQVPSYEMVVAAGDDRAIFDGVGRELNNLDRATFKNGYAVAKFINYKSDGSSGHDATFMDADFFFFRAAEAYLAYAEALTRANGGKATAEAVNAINAVRARAHATQKTSYSLDDILDEWAREFYFEGRRRVDLIRFGKFGGNSDYKWQWKGGTYAGRNFDTYRNIYAIPASQLPTYDNVQNPGY
jgi:hypothetical protein